MGKFDGFVCDSCNKVFRGDAKTRVVMSFQGAMESLGRWTADLCPECCEPLGYMTQAPKRKTNGGSITNPE